MAKLTHSMITSWTATSRTSAASSSGASPTRRCTRSSTSWSVRYAPISWVGGCTRFSSSGRPSSPKGSRPAIQEFAGLWKADKIVYSRTLEEVSSARTRIEREFDPEAIRRLKTTADRELAIGGPDLAAGAFRAGLVDECHLFIAPVVVGGGKRALPTGVRLKLELVDERRFGGGMAYLRYETLPSAS
jgi:dihydrofolate reductase